MYIYIYYDLESVLNSLNLPNDVDYDLNEISINFYFKSYKLLEFNRIGEIKKFDNKKDFEIIDIDELSEYYYALSCLLSELQTKILNYEDFKEQFLVRKVEKINEFSTIEQFIYYYSKLRTDDEKLEFLINQYYDYYVTVKYKTKKDIINNLYYIILDKWTENISNTDKFNPFLMKGKMTC